MNIRQIKESDAKEFANFQQKLDQQTTYMLYEPNECPRTEKKALERIKKTISPNNNAIFVAEIDGIIVGSIAGMREHMNRIKHRMYIVAGILEQYQSMGIGTRLLQALEKWAFENRIHRMYLTVLTKNIKGVGLYKKMGFKIEGTLRDSIFLDGKFEDEYTMAKII